MRTPRGVRRRAAPSTATPQSIGAYPAGAPASAFNFREAYDPISFSGARFAEARVWSLLNPACGGCLDTHLDFAQVRSAECRGQAVLALVKPCTSAPSRS